MADLFSQVSQIQAGETFGPFALSYTDYPRSGGWSISIVITGQTGKEAEAAATNGSGADEFSLTIPASSTATIPGGRKSYVIEAKHTTGGTVDKTYIAERGALLVLHNPRTTTAEMSILASIRAVKAGLATDGQRTMALDGLQLRNMTPAELDSWEARYVRIVNAQIGRAGGNGGVYAIQHRFPQDNRYGAPWYGPYPPPGVR